MSAFDQLERQLRASVARNAGRLPLWPRLRASGPSLMLVAVSSVAALGVAVFVLVELAHRRPPSSPPAAPVTRHHASAHHASPPPSPGPIPSNVDDAVVAGSFNAAMAADRACARAPASRTVSVSQGSPSPAMLWELAILRRRATPADRIPRFYAGGVIPPGPNTHGVYVRYIRLARVVGGESFYLVPVASVGFAALPQTVADRCYRLEVAALQKALPSVPAPERAATRRYGEAQFALGRYNLSVSSIHEGIFIVSLRPGGGGGMDGGESPATLARTGMLGGGSSPVGIVMDGIVPDGVSTVTLRFPATVYHGGRLAALNATGKVVNNVFVVPVPTLFERGGWPVSAVWRSASGQVIKTVDERPFHP